MIRRAAMASTVSDTERGDLMAAKYRTPFVGDNGERVLVDEVEAAGLEALGVKVTKVSEPKAETEGKAS